MLHAFSRSLLQRSIRSGSNRAAAGAGRALNTPVGEPTVLPTEPEAIERTPTPRPTEEQLPGGAEAEDLKHVGTDAGKGHLRAAVKAGAASDVVTGEAAERAERLDRERAQQEGGGGGAAAEQGEPAGVAAKAGGAVAEGAKRVKEAVESAYTKVADQFGSRR